MRTFSAPKLEVSISGVQKSRQKPTIEEALLSSANSFAPTGKGNWLNSNTLASCKALIQHDITSVLRYHVAYSAVFVQRCEAA